MAYPRENISSAMVKYWMDMSVTCITPGAMMVAGNLPKQGKFVSFHEVSCCE